MIITGIILFLCSMIQGIIGFAFNLFAIPLLIWSGFGLSEAIATTAIPIFFQSATSTYKLRKYVLWKEVGFATIFRYMGIPIGIFFLAFITNLDKDSVKQIVAIVILLIVAMQTLLKIKPREHISFIWTVIAFFTSGFTLGLISMGGPPVVVWVMARKWSALTTRAFLSALFFLASPLQVVLLYYSFGSNLLMFFLTGLAFSPVVIIGTLLGVKLGEFLNRDLLRKIILSLLVITSLASIISPYIRS